VADSDVRLEELIKKLRERGCRLTPQRRAVLTILIEDRDHPSVEQIYDQVKQDFPMTSLATVYKTVALLKEMGEVREIESGQGRNRYDGYDPSLHPHLICVECKRIVDLDLPALSELAETVAQQMGYQVLRHRFDFFGICPQCQVA
jgi:Fur family peroxide stress response transcriptional regulator